MDLFNVLKQKNLQLIKEFSDKNDTENLIKQKIISKIFKNSACFFEISIEQAYNIFRELKIQPQDYDDIYIQLTKLN